MEVQDETLEGRAWSFQVFSFSLEKKLAEGVPLPAVFGGRQLAFQRLWDSTELLDRINST